MKNDMLSEQGTLDLSEGVCAHERILETDSEINTT